MRCYTEYILLGNKYIPQYLRKPTYWDVAVDIVLFRCGYGLTG